MSDSIKRKRKKPKAIIADLDDTILNFMSFLCTLYNAKFGTSISDTDLKSWGFNEMEVEDKRGNKVRGEDIRKLFQEYEPEGLYAALPAINESRQALQMIDKLGYKIIILTARDEKYRKQTEVNLIMRNIPYTELHFGWDKAGKINELKKKYDIICFADDRFDTIQSVENLCDLDYTFLVNKAHNETCKIEDDSEVIRIRDLLDIVRYLP